MSLYKSLHLRSHPNGVYRRPMVSKHDRSTVAQSARQAIRVRVLQPVTHQGHGLKTTPELSVKTNRFSASGEMSQP